MGDLNNPQLILMLILPLALVQLSLLAVCVRDWLHRQRFRYLSRWAWLAIIVLVSTGGPLAYLLLGREES